MQRIKPLSAPYPPEVQASFDAIMPAGADPLLLFRTLAASDRHWGRFRAASLLDPGPLCLRAREIVIDRVCARAGSEYEWGVHVAIFAAAAGLTADQVRATVHGAPDDACWSPAERALVRAVDALHDRATLTHAEWSGLRAHFDDPQILEVLLLCGFYRTVAYLTNGLALTPEPGAARFPA
ncbi:MAG: carboxymuconolactone decarboxylase family protein [Caulobacter sp.]|nr:carboxymuconolactone decarboxylase family protein [Caulobacter sp.]